MAGNYPDSPSRRMAWDADGSVPYWINQDGAYAAAMTGAAIVNSESETYHSYDPWNAEDDRDYWLGVLFPEKREFDGFFFAYSEDAAGTGHPSTLQSSLDSTSGWDGTWTTQIADFPNYSPAQGSLYRTAIASLAIASVVGIRLRLYRFSSYTFKPVAYHVYGIISPGETPDRILFLDTLNSDAQFTKPIDYAEVPRGQTQQRTIKLKNNSATKTINTIQITAEDLHLNAGSWYTFSTDDVSYQATLAIGNLGPADTQQIYVKQSVPDAETLGLQAGRLRVSHASLT